MVIKRAGSYKKHSQEDEDDDYHPSDEDQKNKKRPKREEQKKAAPEKKTVEVVFTIDAGKDDELLDLYTNRKMERCYFSAQPFHGKTYANIRMFAHRGASKYVATSKGITMNEEQFYGFLKKIPEMEKTFEKVRAVTLSKREEEESSESEKEEVTVEDEFTPPKKWRKRKQHC